QKFYEAVLEPLSYKRFGADGDAVGFGRDTWAFGIIKTSENIPKMHLAFIADTRAQVDRFFDAAIEAGGRNNGPPRIRPAYDPNYYAAFVLDPDGHNIEAVCRKAPASSQ
ncbi:MAG: VOC family protein, partial [Alphaproteobacteria bacterium]